MPRKTAKKITPATRRTTLKAGPTIAKRSRAKSGEVPARILEALATGPKSRPQLLSAAGCSTASLYLHLKALNASRQIAITGRRAPITLAPPTVSVSEPRERKLSVIPAKSAAALVAAPVYVAGPLHEALEAVTQRFEAPARIGEKLHTLEHLAKSMPPAVADILIAIRADLLRLSPGRDPGS